MRPLIGITTYREQARWGFWDVPAVLLPATYADAVAECGGEPVLLPTGAISAAVVARLDGLVLAGGADAAPAPAARPPHAEPPPGAGRGGPRRPARRARPRPAAARRLPGDATAQRPARRGP